MKNCMRFIATCILYFLTISYIFPLELVDPSQLQSSQKVFGVSSGVVNVNASPFTPSTVEEAQDFVSSMESGKVENKPEYEPEVSEGNDDYTFFSGDDEEFDDEGMAVGDEWDPFTDENGNDNNEGEDSNIDDVVVVNDGEETEDVVEDIVSDEIGDALEDLGGNQGEVVPDTTTAEEINEQAEAGLANNFAFISDPEVMDLALQLLGQGADAYVTIGQNGMDATEYYVENAQEIAELVEQAIIQTFEELGQEESIALLAGNSTALSMLITADVLDNLPQDEILLQHKEEVANVIGDAIYLYLEDQGEALAGIAQAGTEEAILIASEIAAGMDLAEVVAGHNQQVADLTEQAISMIAQDLGYDEDYINIVSTGSGLAVLISSELYLGDDTLDIVNSHHNEIVGLVGDSVEYAAVQSGADAQTADWLSQGASLSTIMVIGLANDEGLEDLFLENVDGIVNVSGGAIELIGQNSGLDEDLVDYLVNANGLAINLSADLMSNEDALMVLLNNQEDIAELVGDGFVLYGGQSGWSGEQTALASSGASLGAIMAIQMMSADDLGDVVLGNQSQIVDLSGDAVAFALAQNGLADYSELGSEAMETALNILIEAGLSEKEIAVILDEMSEEVAQVTGDAAYLAGIESGLNEDESQLASEGAQLLTQIAIDLANGEDKDSILAAYDNQIAGLAGDVSGAIAANSDMTDEQVGLIESGVTTGTSILLDLEQGMSVLETINNNEQAIASALSLYVEYIANENGLSDTDTAALLEGVDTIVAILIDSLNGMSAEDILAGNLEGIKEALYAANESLAVHLELEKDQLGLLNTSADVALALVGDLISGGDLTDALVNNQALLSGAIRDAVVVAATDAGYAEDVVGALADASQVSTEMIIEIAAGDKPLDEVLLAHKEDVAGISATGAELAALEAGASQEAADLAGVSTGLAVLMAIEMNSGADPAQVLVDNKEQLMEVGGTASELTAMEMGLEKDEAAVVGQGTATIIDIAVSLNAGEDLTEILQENKENIMEITGSGAAIIAENQDLDEGMVEMIESGTGALTAILLDIQAEKDTMDILNDNQEVISGAVQLAALQAGEAAELEGSELALLGSGVETTINILYDVLNGKDGTEILIENSADITTVIKEANELIAETQGLSENDLAVMNSGVDLAVQLALGIMEGQSAEEIFVENVEGINTVIQAGIADIAEHNGLSSDTVDFASVSSSTVLNVAADILEGKDASVIIEENQLAITETVTTGANLIVDMDENQAELLETAVGTGLSIAVDILEDKPLETIIKENGDGIVACVDIGTTVVSEAVGLEENEAELLAQTTSTVANITLDIMSGMEGEQVFIQNSEGIAEVIGGATEFVAENYGGLEGSAVDALSGGAVTAVNIASDIIEGKDASQIFIENQDGIAQTLGATVNVIAESTGMDDPQASALAAGTMTTLNIVGDVLQGKEADEIFIERNDEIATTVGSISNVVATGLGAGSENTAAITSGVSTAINIFGDVLEGKEAGAILAENQDGIMDTIQTGLVALNGSASSGGVNVAFSALEVGVDLFDSISSGDFNAIEFMQENTSDIVELGVNIMDVAGVSVGNFPVLQAANVAIEGISTIADMYTDWDSGMTMEEVIAANSGEIANLTVDVGRVALAAATGGASEAVLQVADIGLALISGGNVNSNEAIIKFTEIICGIDIDGDGGAGFIGDDGEILMAVGSGIQYVRDAVVDAGEWVGEQIYEVAGALGLDDELDAVLEFAGDALGAVGDVAMAGMELAFEGIGAVVDAFDSMGDSFFGAPAPPVCGSTIYTPDIIPNKTVASM